jgi:hypothetical protein
MLVTLFINLMASFAAIAAAKIITGSGVNGIGALFAAFCLSIAPMAAFVTLGAFLSLVFGHPSLSMFMSLAVYAAMQGVTLYSAKIGAVFFTSHLEWYKMFISGGAAAALVNTFLMTAAYTGFFGAVGAALFERYEA